MALNKVKHQPFGYTITKNPSDYPNKYTLRGWFIESGVVTPANDVIVVEMTEEALAKLRDEMRAIGKIKFPRGLHDDPVIVESWI